MTLNDQIYHKGRVIYPHVGVVPVSLSVSSHLCLQEEREEARIGASLPGRGVPQLQGNTRPHPEHGRSAFQPR